MSESNPNSPIPAKEGVDSTPNGASETVHEWAYSGKAMRARCVLYWVGSLVVVGLMGTLTFLDMLGEAYLTAWIATIVVLLLLWGQFYCVYFYRTWTIRYRLTEHRLDTIQGLFTKTVDTMELLYIDDLRMVITLWDRLLNGGVGKIIVFSKVDKTDSQLTLIGVDEPQKMFDILNAARAKVRGKRGFITSGG